AHAIFICRSLFVRESHRSYYRSASGASHCGHRGAGNAGQADLAAVLLHARFDGYYLSVCYRSRADLLRQRLCQPEGVLDAWFDFRSDLPGGAFAGRRALPTLLLELGVRSVQKEERARLAREFLFFLIKSGTICTSR